MAKDKVSKINAQKPIAIRLSRSFELLSFEIVKDFLNDASIEYAKLTDEQKDGGYDGIFLITYPGSNISKIILMEAKLRSNPSGDLRLADFAKSILVSINELADSIYITTNQHFSKETINRLTRFSCRTGLSIFPLDQNHIAEWINDHKEQEIEVLRADFNDVIEFLLKSPKFKSSYSLPLIPTDNSTRNQCFTIIGKKRVSYINDIRNSLRTTGVAKNYLLAGPYGVGKSYFFHAATQDLNVIEVNLSFDKTYREIFLSLFYQIFFDSCKQLLTKDTFVELITDGGLRLSKDESIILMTILFEPQNSDLDCLNTAILERYLKKILQPVLRRVKTALYIHDLNSITDKHSQIFLSRMITALSGELTIFLEIDTDRIKWDSPSYDTLRETCLRNNFLRKDFYEWNRKEASCFLRYKNIPDSFADKIISSFGCNAAILDAALALHDISEQIQIANIIKDYRGIRKVQYLFTTINDILECTLLTVYPQLKEAFFYFYIFDGQIYVPDTVEYFSILAEISNVYSFVRQEGNFFVVTKDAYLNAFEVCVKHLQIIEIRQYAKRALDDMQYYSLDAIQHAGKCLLLGILCKDSRLILENYRIYMQYLHKQKAFVVAKKLLIDIYEILMDGEIEIDAPNHFFILNLIVECYLNIGDGDASIDEYLRDAKNLIEAHSSEWDSVEHFTYDKGRYYKKICGLALRRGKYNDLVDYAQRGIELLQSNNSERCTNLMFEFWNYKALGVKHLSNLADSIQVYRDCLRQTHKLTPQLICWFLGARASHFTYRDPHKSKVLIKNILKISRETNNPRVIAHHENNLGGLSLMELDCEDAATHCSEAYRLSEEYSISTEQGRCQNLLGCLTWINGDSKIAIERFQQSINIFRMDSHETYTWIPLVNLSALYMELGDIPAAYSSAIQAEEILMNSHASQLARINEIDLLFSKNYIAILYILYVLYKNGDDNTIDFILQNVNSNSLQHHFADYIKVDNLMGLLKDSHVFLDNHFMLKA